MDIFRNKKNMCAVCTAAVMLVSAVIFIPPAAGKDTAVKGKPEKGTVSKTVKKSESVKNKTAAPKAENEDITGIPSREYTDEDFVPKMEEDSYAWLVFKTIIILGLLVAGFYYFLRFVTRRTGMQVLGEDVLQVLSVVPIGTNKYLQIVDLAGRIVVLGVSDSAINYITEITDREEIDRIRLLSSRSPGPRRSGFQDYVNRQLGSLVSRVSDARTRRGNVSVKSDRGAGLDYLQMQKKRLKKMNGFDDE